MPPTPPYLSAPEDMILGEIAHCHLFIDTLVVQNSDGLDFHDVGVAGVLDALRAAFAAGRVAAALTRVGAKRGTEG